MKPLSVLIISILLSSCAYNAVEHEAPEINTLKVSDKFRITLPENHTTGYVWFLSNVYNTSVISYQNSVWHGNEKGVDFNFQATAPGKTELVFYSIMYRDTAAEKHFIIEAK